MNVSTPAQGLRLLFAQSPGFKRAFMESRISIRIKDDELNDGNASMHLDRNLDDGEVIHFVPVVEGGVTAMVVIAVVLAVASVAYSIYMARNMKNQNAAEASNTIDNNSFTSAENRVGQGRPVPILLGEMVCGSNVISLGINTENESDWTQIIDWAGNLFD